MLIQSAADVIDTLRPFGFDRVAAPKADFSASPVEGDANERDRQAVTGLLSPAPVSIDEIIRQSGLPSAIVQTVLLELELAGKIDRHAGGRVSLR
jgi:DNA processing protein